MAIRMVPKDGGTSRLIGAAFADASARKLGISEFLDDEMFSNTEVSISFNRRAERVRLTD